MSEASLDPSQRGPDWTHISPVAGSLFHEKRQFWAIFSETINENPPPKNEIEAVLPQFKSRPCENCLPVSRRGYPRAFCRF